VVTSDRMLDLVEEVAGRLRGFGMNAVFWDSGGGTVGVGIAQGGVSPDELKFYFGTAAEVWAGEILDESGQVVGSLWTDAPSGGTDADSICAAIIKSIARLADLRATPG